MSCKSQLLMEHNLLGLHSWGARAQWHRAAFPPGTPAAWGAHWHGRGWHIGLRMCCCPALGKPHGLIWPRRGSLTSVTHSCCVPTLIRHYQRHTLGSFFLFGSENRYLLSTYYMQGRAVPCRRFTMVMAANTMGSVPVSEQLTFQWKKMTRNRQVRLHWELRGGTENMKLLDAVAHACNSSASGGRGRRIA